jgi:N-acetylmuramoyl-L-alanine amidase
MMYNMVILEPGHRYSKPGAVKKSKKAPNGKAWVENFMNVATANVLFEKLTGLGIIHKVNMTRTSPFDDTPLTQVLARAEIMARNSFYYGETPVKASNVLYVAIHWNTGPKCPHGLEIWIPDRYMGIWQKYNQVAQGIAKKHNMPWRGFKDADRWGKSGLYVSKMRIPAILIETGFMGCDFATKENWEITPTGEWHVPYQSPLWYYIQDLGEILRAYFLDLLQGKVKV